jgi:hypothetical protein
MNRRNAFVGALRALLGTCLSVVLSATGCSATGIGDPCTPELEYQRDFRGFDIDQVVFESRSFQCQTRLCLVNHFRGRVTCPYGQDEQGVSRSSGPCLVPGTNERVTGEPGAPKGAKVEAQCLDRTVDRAVYCSCRCSNTAGRTDDGANYCACADGFECTQLSGSIGSSNEGLTGGFCTKKGTTYGTSACGSSCDKSQSATTCKGELDGPAAPNTPL